MLSFLLLLLALFALVVPALSQAAVNITFTLQCRAAPWGVRRAASVEVYKKALTFGSSTFPVNSLILFGGANATHSLNDVWASSDQGRSWQLVSGLNNGRTTYPGADFPGYTVDSQSRLFVVAGTRPGQGATGHVWMSTNGGVSWTQQLNSSAATGLPPRSFPDLYVDSTDALYAIAGLMPDGSNDVWRSSDQGRNWYKQTSMPFPTPPGRSSGALLHFPSTQLSQSGLDVLTYMGGYGRPPITYYNDIYISTDRGAKWLTITLNAPWTARDNFNAEITRDGVIVISAGFRDNGGDLNDLWISMDGGWTWGQCLEDAPFSDRRWQSTVLDQDGFLYTIAGDERPGNVGPRIYLNDVWRSSFSFHDLTALSKSCNVPIPACGTGLTCLPGPNTQVVNGRVTCPAVAACDTNNLGFVPVTAHAAFPPRHSPGVEVLKKQVTIGSARWPAGSMVLVGGTGVNNSALTDTWISSNARDWTQVSASGFQGSWWSGYTIDSKSQIYKIGGEMPVPGAPNMMLNDVWMSSNAGVTWTRQVGTTALPKRGFPDTWVQTVGTTDTIFVIGGLDGDGLNDVWSSTDSGRNWKLSGRLPFASPPGRSSASLLIYPSPALGKTILTYFGGFSRGGAQGPAYHNDVWVSSNAGSSWTLLTERAPWAERDNFQGEVTKDGLMVFTAGYNDREALNDVWVSADGGHTWGQCVAEASFSDRRWQTTLLDSLGYFYLVGGEEVEGGVYALKNDVWKSTFSLTNKAKVAKACKITYPTCQATGLSCWPSSSVRRDNKGQVTCQTLTSFCTRQEESSSSATWWDSSSTGVEPAASSAVSAGMVALIVVLILAGTGAIVGFVYYSRKNSVNASPIIPGVGTEGLLGPVHTDSAVAASTSDYYAQPMEGSNQATQAL